MDDRYNHTQIMRSQKIRDFIWQHWNEKRRGYIKMTTDMVDWVTTDHIFIEPDQEGQWHVAWKSAYISLLPGGISGVNTIRGRYTVERAEGKGLDDWRIVVKSGPDSILYRTPQCRECPDEY